MERFAACLRQSQKRAAGFGPARPPATQHWRESALRDGEMGFQARRK